MKRSLRVKWTYPRTNQQMDNQKVELIQNYIVFQQKTQQINKIFESKVIPYIKDDQKYYLLPKYQNKVKQKFINLQMEKNNQKQQQKEKQTKLSKYKQIHIYIQFLYKKQYEYLSFSKINQQINQLHKKLTQRMGNMNKSFNNSYLNKVKHFKLKNAQKQNFLTFKIYFLISQPLVKNININEMEKEDIKQFLKSKIHLQKHSQLIKNIHKSKNVKINLIIDQKYLSWNELQHLVQQTKVEAKQKKGQTKIDYFIIQIYTQIYQKNKHFYVSMENSELIGMEQRIKLNKVMKKINQIPNLYLVILMGQRMRLLAKPKTKNKTNISTINNETTQKQCKRTNAESSELKLSKIASNISKAQYKQWFQNIDAPIFTINSFDIAADSLFIDYCLKQIYKNIFRRQNLKQKLKIIKDNIKKFRQLTLECCCLHTNLDESIYKQKQKPIWAKIVQALGIKAAHRIFFHNQNYIQFKDSILQDSFFASCLTNFIMNQKQLYKTKTLCVQNQQYHRYRANSDFQFFNKQRFVPWPQHHQNIIYGVLKEDNIKRDKTDFYRPTYLYQIIKNMTSNKYKVLAILGSSKSGKSLFIQLAQRYIKNRFGSQKYKFIRIRNWLNDYQNGILIPFILKQTQRNSDSKFKLIINFGKIHNESKQQFQNFLKLYFKNCDFRMSNVLIICAVSLSHKIKLKSNQIMQYQIKDMSKSQILFMLFQNQSLSIDNIQQLSIFQTILSSFQYKEQTKNQNDHCQKKKSQKLSFQQLYFNNFYTNLPYLIKQLPIIYKKYYDEGIQNKIMPKIIKQKLKQFQNQTIMTLNEIRKDDKQFYNAVGFVCSFKQGFFICDFNRLLALKNMSYFDFFLKYKNRKIFKIDLLQNDKKSHKFGKTIQILAENKCYENFKKVQLQKFYIRKINYFLNFYHKVYELIKMNPTDQIYSHCKKSIKKQGIFIFGYQYLINKLIQRNKVQYKLIQIQNLSKMTNQQKQFIYYYVLEKHIKSFLQFLKQSSQNGQIFINKFLQEQEQEQRKKQIQQIQLKIIYAILLVVVIHSCSQVLPMDKKLQLNDQIIDYFKRNKIVQFSPQYTAIYYQIKSIVQQIEIENNNKQNQMNSIIFQNNNQQSQYMVLNDFCYCQQLRRAILKRTKQLREYYYNINETQQQKNVNGLNIRQQKKNYLLQKIKIILQRIQKCQQNLFKNHKNNLNQNDEIYNKNYLQQILNLLCTKVIIKFYFFNIDSKILNQVAELDANRIRTEISNILNKINQKQTKNNPIVLICNSYLKIVINAEDCTYDDVPCVQIRNLPIIQFKEIYDYIERKLNPKLIFKRHKQQNIALFMKASFLKYHSLQYNYVRMENMIYLFMSQTFKQYDLSLLFLNLNKKNIEMVSNEEAKVTYFILSVDTIKNQKQGTIYLLFESQLGTESIEVSLHDFMKWLNKISFKFLIIFGANSHILNKEIQKRKINIQNFCIISLTYKQRDLNHSTYPICKQNTVAFDIIQQFIKIQNCQRMMEMTICSLLYFIINQNNNQIIKMSVIQNFIEDSKKVSINILEKWYINNNKLAKIRYEINEYVYLKQKLQFPLIKEGKLKNLTLQIIAIPKNFIDDIYYQNIGRVKQISQIVSKLFNNRNCLIRLQGQQRSGKTSLLKEAGWICYSRKLFELGVFYYDIKNFFQNFNHQILLKLIKRQYVSKKSMLLLFDNLDQQTFLNNQDYFCELFQSINKFPCSIIYATQNCTNKQQAIESKFIEKKYKINGKKKSSTFTYNINKIQNIEKICLALINIRNRSPLIYQQIFFQYFQTLNLLEIKQTHDKIFANIYEKYHSSSKKIINKKTNQQKVKIKNNEGKVNLFSKKQFESFPLILNKKITMPYQSQAQPIQTLKNYKSAAEHYNQVDNENLIQYRNKFQNLGTQIKQEQINEQNESQKLVQLYQKSKSSKSIFSDNKQIKMLFKRQKKQQNMQIKNFGSDIYQILEMCNHFKQKVKIEGKNLNFCQSYLNFDVNELIQKIESLRQSNIYIKNNFYIQQQKYY